MKTYEHTYTIKLKLTTDEDQSQKIYSNLRFFTDEHMWDVVKEIVDIKRDEDEN